MTPFRAETLANGVVIEFFDVGNRYFGDYHRICVEAHLTVPHPDGGEPLRPAPKRLERMGVAGSEVAAVRARLVEDFLHHAGRYLARPDYPARLVAATARSGSRRPLGSGGHAR